MSNHGRTLLGRWEEMWDAAHNSQSPWWNPADKPPTWPFEITKQGAFAHFVDIFNRTDPAGLPASDYAEPRDNSNANHFTFDAGYDDLNRFEQRVFGRGSYASMTPICRPMTTEQRLRAQVRSVEATHGTAHKANWQRGL